MKIAHMTAAGAAVVAVAAGYGTLHHRTSASAAPPQHGATAAAVRPIRVSLSEYAVKASAHRTTHGKLAFIVKNVGKIEHELVVLRTAKPADRLGRSARIQEVVHIGEVGGLQAGHSKRLTLSLTPGHYSLVCNLPGHYMAGMHTDFTVS